MGLPRTTLRSRSHSSYMRVIFFFVLKTIGTIENPSLLVGEVYTVKFSHAEERKTEIIRETIHFVCFSDLYILRGNLLFKENSGCRFSLKLFFSCIFNQ